MENGNKYTTLVFNNIVLFIVVKPKKNHFRNFTFLPNIYISMILYIILFSKYLILYEVPTIVTFFFTFKFSTFL